MKTKITIATVLITSVVFLVSCGKQSSENKSESPATEQTANVKYQCPMKCEGDKTYVKSGSCPICNMDLKAMEATTEHMDTTHHQQHQ